MRKVPRIFVLLKSQKTSGIWHDYIIKIKQKS
ncbi:MAG: hypothetical protein ACI81T_004645, partial [Bacteroidia bacterium]